MTSFVIQETLHCHSPHLPHSDLVGAFTVKNAPLVEVLVIVVVVKVVEVVEVVEIVEVVEVVEVVGFVEVVEVVEVVDVVVVKDMVVLVGDVVVGTVISDVVTVSVVDCGFVMGASDRGRQKLAYELFLNRALSEFNIESVKLTKHCSVFFLGTRKPP